MSENKTNIPRKSKRVKYKPSKRGKIAWGVALVAQVVAVLIIWLSVFLNFSFYGIVVAIASIMIAMFAYIVLFVDIIHFNKINNLEYNDTSNALYLILGVIIGFMFGKFL